MAGQVLIPYSPRPLQHRIHNLLSRFTVLVCHRRFGKTILAVNQLIKDALTTKLPDPRAHYICPLHKQAKQVAWDYAKRYSRPVPGININEAELRIDYPNGGRLQLLGSDNADSLRGLYSDSVVCDEFSQFNPRAWSEVIRPMLSDRKGKAIFPGTPQGHNQFYDLYQQAGELEGWSRYVYRASETGIVPDSELAALRREMTEAEYAQEYECSWSAAIRGAYYAKEMDQAERDGRITEVPYDPNYPVISAWDLGVKDSTVIWFAQEVGSSLHFINCKAYKGTGLPDIIKDMKELPYVYDQHKAPHDIEVTELGTGVTRREIAQNHGISFDVAPRHGIMDGITATRSLLARAVFDQTNCNDGIEALKLYRTEYNEVRKVFSVKPLHDWTSDYADALRYYAMCPSNTFYGGELDYSRANIL